MQSLVAAILALALVPVPALAAPAKGTPGETARGGAADAPALPSLERRTPFTHFGSPPVLALRGGGAAAKVEFGSRADELVVRASLRLRYAFSPGIDAARAHVRLVLNDVALGLLPLDAAKAGGSVEHELAIDPRLVAGFNRLAIELVAPAAPDAAQPAPWVDVSGASELVLATHALAVADDLARLPEPFFDRRDQRRLALPFVLAAKPSRETLRAAAIVASWFGQHAAWRGARFPVHLDGAAGGHAIAFATNAERPSFLAAVPPVAGPELRVATNPADGRSKLLLVLGRDGADLVAAAQALVLGGAAMSGPRAQVSQVRAGEPRKDYDAPAWVRPDRKMKFAELIGWPQQLEAAGRAPRLEPIRVELRMPTDLVTRRGPGVPMRLKFRYTPPACAGEAYLDVGINDELLKVVALRVAQREGTAAGKAPLPEAMADATELFVPSYRLRGRNRLEFAFRFAPRAPGGCDATTAAGARAAVDPDSTIDFSGFPHYARRPELAHFVGVGLPFTKRADLSQAVLVLPEEPVAPEIEALLALAGRMGEATGHAATGLRLAGPADDAAFADADLLVIGAPPRQSLLDRWGERLPVALTGAVRRAGAPAGRAPALPAWLGFDEAPVATGQASFVATGPIAALLEFESPVTPGRSVVALTAADPGQLRGVLDALDDPKLARAMRGAAVIVQAGKVESLLAGPAYETGYLPPWTGLGHWLLERSLVAALLAAFVLAALAFAAWRARRALARRLRRGA
ncbi:MAG: cellulose biosynthesis cyclic di-GMP-binding regulatory protein BcsB [Burkholderiales bacterium]